MPTNCELSPVPKYTISENPVGNIRITKVEPNQSKTNVPVIIAPGWSESRHIFEGAQIVLANGQRSSIVIDHPRIGGQIEKHNLYPEAELRKANNLLRVIDASGHQKVDVIAHSEGAIYTIIAASMNPDKFRNIILIGPGGILEDDKFPQLLKRFTKKVFQNLKQAAINKDVRKEIIINHLRSAGYILKNPLRAFQEAIAISKMDTRSILKTLRDKHINIVLIHHFFDEAFPPDRIQSSIARDIKQVDPLPDNFSEVGLHPCFDGVLCVRGLHDDSIYFPEMYFQWAELMLTALENRRSI